MMPEDGPRARYTSVRLRLSSTEDSTFSTVAPIPFYYRRLGFLNILVGTVVLTLLWNEYLIYFAKIGVSCSWPERAPELHHRAFVMADTHLLGKMRGHWLDKLKREWQMHRSYQTAQLLLRPQSAFFLGDLFDEGQWADHDTLEQYAERFESLFGVPGRQEEPKIYVVPGNHDLGFHYVLNDYSTDWYKRRFNLSMIDLRIIGERPFIMINSMALYGDKCRFCAEAERQLGHIKKLIQCAKVSDDVSANCSKLAKEHLPKRLFAPIVMQHFPLFREDERECADVPSDDPQRTKTYKRGWDALDEKETDLLLKSVRPAAAFSGHSHRSCTRRWKGDPSFTEYTVNSFSWRNGPDPSLLLVSFPTHSSEEPQVSVCFLPNEPFVLLTYLFSIAFLLLYILLYIRAACVRHRHARVLKTR